MIDPTLRELFFAPTQELVEAQIVTLTADMIDKQISNDWWHDEALKEHFDVPQIDQHWNWNEMEIGYGDRILVSEKYAIIAGENGAVQGAMMISSEAVKSVLDPQEHGLFIELLFTAPRNRHYLRRDGQPFLQGVGSELLTWGAWLSRSKGLGGRLLLDASPDFVGWYGKRGLQTLALDNIVFEGVNYTPMELPPDQALNLLKEWEAA